VKLTTHLHLVPRLGIRGATPPLHQYLFMVWCLIKQWIRLYGMVLCQAQRKLYVFPLSVVLESHFLLSSLFLNLVLFRFLVFLFIFIVRFLLLFLFVFSALLCPLNPCPSAVNMFRFHSLSSFFFLFYFFRHIFLYTSHVAVKVKLQVLSNAP
jgi:hypothetical protein